LFFNFNFIFSESFLNQNAKHLMNKLIGFYFFPTIVGWKRKDGLSIFMVNLFLGWTIIGWIAVYFWASANEAVELRSSKVVSKPQSEPVIFVPEETVILQKSAELVA